MESTSGFGGGGRYGSVLRTSCRSHVHLAVRRTIPVLVDIKIVFADWALVLFLDEDTHAFGATALGRGATIF